MRLTQITHHDLDGYGASTVAARLTPVARVVHVPRYSDVGPVLDEELKRLNRAGEAEALLVTDLGLEEQTIAGLKRFAAMNRRRDAGARHRLTVLDHHASSLDQLRRQGLEPRPEAEGAAGVWRADLEDPEIAVVVDEGASATRMARDRAALYAPGAAGGAGVGAGAGEGAGEGAGDDPDLDALVGAIDALDLWRKDSPAFPGGHALDELFWDNATSYVPPGHPWHDRFVSGLLMAAAARLRAGAGPADLERAAPALRGGVVDALLAGEPGDDAALTSRQRLARALARSDALFRPLKDGTLLSFGLDAGTFQRVSDLVMADGRARRVVNVQRTGTLSFRSTDGTALEGARLFRGGGHRDAAGGRLPGGSAFSLGDAVAQVEPVLNPERPADGPFAALKNWKG